MTAPTAAAARRNRRIRDRTTPVWHPGWTAAGARRVGRGSRGRAPPRGLWAHRGRVAHVRQRRTIPPGHPVCRRPAHRGAGRGQGDKVERPTGRTTLPPWPRSVRLARVDGGRGGAHPGVGVPPPEASWSSSSRGVARRRARCRRASAASRAALSAHGAPRLRGAPMHKRRSRQPSHRSVVVAVGQCLPVRQHQVDAATSRSTPVAEIGETYDAGDGGGGLCRSTLSVASANASFSLSGPPPMSKWPVSADVIRSR